MLKPLRVRLLFTLLPATGIIGSLGLLERVSASFCLAVARSLEKAALASPAFGRGSETVDAHAPEADPSLMPESGDNAHRLRASRAQQEADLTLLNDILARGERADKMFVRAAEDGSPSEGKVAAEELRSRMQTSEMCTVC